MAPLEETIYTSYRCHKRRGIEDNEAADSGGDNQHRSDRFMVGNGGGIDCFRWTVSYSKDISHWAFSSTQIAQCSVEPGTAADAGIIVSAPAKSSVSVTILIRGSRLSILS